jgi:hypothetical protein
MLLWGYSIHEYKSLSVEYSKAAEGIPPIDTKHCPSERSVNTRQFTGFRFRKHKTAITKH